VTSPGQARHETDEQLDALRVERGGKCTMQCNASSGAVAPTPRLAQWVGLLLR